MSCWGKYCCDLRGGSEVVFYLAHVEEYSHERNSVAMNLITPDEGLSVLDQHLSSIERQLVLIKHDLETLDKQLLAGKIGSKITQIRPWGPSSIGFVWPLKRR